LSTTTNKVGILQVEKGLQHSYTNNWNRKNGYNFRWLWRYSLSKLEEERKWL